MVLVKVLEIGPVRDITTTYGEKKIRNYKVEEASTKTPYNVSYFLKKDNPELIVGDEVFMDIVQNGEYWNCKRIQLMEGIAGVVDAPKEHCPAPSVPVQPVTTPDPTLPPTPGQIACEKALKEQEMWISKELRSYRGKAVMYAIETLKLSGEIARVHTLETPPLTTSEVQELITLQADQYVEYIYKKEKA